MRILKELVDAQLIIIYLEVNMENESKNAANLCAKQKVKIVPLNTTHGGRPTLMKEENSIDN